MKLIKTLTKSMSYNPSVIITMSNSMEIVESKDNYITYRIKLTGVLKRLYVNIEGNKKVIKLYNL